MATYVVELPAEFSTDRAQGILKSLDNAYKTSFLPYIDQVTFDFSKCSSISPVGLIFIRMWRDALVDKGKRTFYRKSNAETDSFLKRMRLLPQGDLAFDDSLESKYFYYIHRCQTIAECADAQKDIVSNVVPRDAVPEKTYCAIDYMINELWDNAGVHGYECYNTETYPKPVYICALEHESSYEVCIGDRGQGIYSSLQKNNPKLQGRNKKDSVKAAVQNGISGHPNGSPGFGLYSSAEFIRGGNGILYIWSSGCYLEISSKDDRIYNSPFLMGTLVSFVINKDAILPFEEILNAHTICNYQAKEYIEDVIGGLFDEQ